MKSRFHMSEIIMENTSYMVKQLIWIDLDQIHKIN